MKTLTGSENMTEEAVEKLRKINCDLGSLSRSMGSAIYTSGETCVIAAVNGPGIIGHKKLSIDEAVVDVCYRPRTGQTTLHDKVAEATLTKISEVSILRSQFPRSVIAIAIQEVQDSGGLLACCINALCLALVNSGLPMKFLFAAVCCMIDSEDKIIIDPTAFQLKKSKAVFTLTMEAKGNIISTDITGVYTEDQFQEIVRRCQAGSTVIFQFYRDIVRKFSDRIAL